MRATLILVPLFGLQYLIFPVRPAEGTALYDFYHYFIALLMSLQVFLFLHVHLSVCLSVPSFCLPVYFCLPDQLHACVAISSHVLW